MKSAFLLIMAVLTLSTSIMAEPPEPEVWGTNGVYIIPTWTSDWNGVTYDNYEAYCENSKVVVFGQDVVISKRDFMLQVGIFGAALGAIICFVLFRAVL